MSPITGSLPSDGDPYRTVRGDASARHNAKLTSATGKGRKAFYIAAICSSVAFSWRISLRWWAIASPGNQSGGRFLTLRLLPHVKPGFPLGQLPCNSVRHRSFYPNRWLSNSFTVRIRGLTEIQLRVTDLGPSP